VNYENSFPNSSFTKKVLCTSETTNFIFIKQNNVWQVLYQQTQYVASLLPTHTMCDKSFTSWHRVWQVLYQQTQCMQKSPTNRHNVCKVLYQQTWCVTKTSTIQNEFTSTTSGHPKHFCKASKQNQDTYLRNKIITMAYIVSLYRKFSLHILNQWITDPAIFKDDKFKYHHYYNNDEFEHCTIMHQHKQPFTYMLPVWKVCFSFANNGHLLTSIKYQRVRRYSTACVPVVKNIINAFVNFISSIQICTEFF